MNKSTAQSLAQTLMAHHGLEGWRFQYDRAKGRAGLCQYGKRTISMSEEYVSLNDEAQVRDTILHEIAHALVGHKAGHGPVWQAKARAIGCTGERTTSAQITTQEPRYTGTCRHGGEVVAKYRRRPGDRTIALAVCKKHRTGIDWTDSVTGLSLREGGRSVRVVGMEEFADTVMRKIAAERAAEKISAPRPDLRAADRPWAVGSTDPDVLWNG